MVRCLSPGSARYRVRYGANGIQVVDQDSRHVTYMVNPREEGDDEMKVNDVESENLGVTDLN